MGRVLLIEAIRHDCRHAPAGKTAQTPQDASKTSGPKHGRLTLAGNRCYFPTSSAKVSGTEMAG